ncbi:MAG: helical backbone metal receptor [Nitritalea sp.]
MRSVSGRPSGKGNRSLFRFSLLLGRLGRAGFENVMTKSRYPEIKIEELKTLSPDFLLLSSEPFPFKQKHIDEFAAHLPQTSIQLVDGEMFSWYGSRLRYFREYVEKYLL